MENFPQVFMCKSHFISEIINRNKGYTAGHVRTSAKQMEILFESVQKDK